MEACDFPRGLPRGLELLNPLPGRHGVDEGGAVSDAPWRDGVELIPISWTPDPLGGGGIHHAEIETAIPAGLPGARWSSWCAPDGHRRN